MYLRNPEFVGEFDGKVIKAKMHQLSFADAMTFEAIDEDQNQTVELARMLAVKLPSYVIEFDGPVDSEGVKVPIEEVCSIAYFAPLVVAMGKRLIQAASPPKVPPVASA